VQPVARIPDEQLEQLKQQVSLVSLVEARGVELRRVGKDLVGCCPFHDDREPSLVVTPAKNLWHCLGTCATGGSVIDWVMRAEGVSFRHAVELLRDGAITSSSGPAPKWSTVRRLEAPVTQGAADAELLGQVVGFYHRTLRESPEAMQYLKRRKIAHPDAIATFQLGYANRTLGLRLPDKRRAAGAELRGRLTALGVFRESGHEHLTGSIVVPISDEHGHVTELYGRKIRDDLRAGTPTHLYLPGPHRGVFHLAAFTASDEIILCESLIDALTFWCAGFRHVTAAFGTEGFTIDLGEAFATHGIRRVLIAYDNDDAGNTAASKLAAELLADGIECFRVVTPVGADVNDLAVTARVPTDVLGRRLRSARWMGKGTPPSRQHPTVEPVADSSLAAEPDNVAEQHVVDEMVEQPVPAVDPVDASPAAPVPADDDMQVTGREVLLSFGERRWRVRGLDKTSSFDTLRVNVMCSAPDGYGGTRFHVDTFDLYSARARSAFLVAAAAELGVGEDVVKRDLGRVLLACERVADDVVTAAQAPADEPRPISDAEKRDALALLRDPNLVERIVSDFAQVGVVGEQTNCLVGYLAAVSRKLSRPLAVIVQSTSAAGKSALMDAVLSLVPEEDCVRFSAMTGQSLFYVGESDLAHKVLAIAEEEGAERAAYALKLLQSDGELSIASTGKDTASGRLVTHTYRVTGPTAIVLTTTSIEVDEELLNRCLVLTVDEDRAQTKAIHDRQRTAQTLHGLLADVDRDDVIRLHRNAQRLLGPLAVVNPFADRLTFADSATRTRRDHLKYLTLISAVTLLHQHQREVKTATRNGKQVRYVETTPADIALANTLAHEVLGRSLDELPPGTRRLLDALHAYVTARCERDGLDRDLVRFTRRQLREQLGVGDTQLKVHLARLVDLELVVPHRLESGGFGYELAWHPDASSETGRVLPGLIDPQLLGDTDDAVTTADRSGSEATRSGPGRPPVGGRSAPGRGGLHALEPLPLNDNSRTDEQERAESTVPASTTARVVVAGGTR
jgi:DNA primase